MLILIPSCEEAPSLLVDYTLLCGGDEGLTRLLSVAELKMKRSAVPELLNL